MAERQRVRTAAVQHPCTDPEAPMRNPTAVGLILLLVVIIGAAALQLELATR
jgi:hypothetical protein